MPAQVRRYGSENAKGSGLISGAFGYSAYVERCRVLPSLAFARAGVL